VFVFVEEKVSMRGFTWRFEGKGI